MHNRLFSFLIWLCVICPVYSIEIDPSSANSVNPTFTGLITGGSLSIGNNATFGGQGNFRNLSVSATSYMGSFVHFGDGIIIDAGGGFTLPHPGSMIFQGGDSAINSPDGLMLNMRAYNQIHMQIEDSGFVDKVLVNSSSVTFMVPFVPTSKTTAQLKLITPAGIGQMYWDTTTNEIAVSTGTTPYAFKYFSGGVTPP